jgi:Peptidoglycan-synthase activator LpoB
MKSVSPTDFLRFIPATLALLLLGLGGFGCASNVTRLGYRAALDSFDLQAMTAQMAQSIAADPEVQAEFQRSGPLTIVVEPVQNRLTAEIIPRGAAQAFTARVRVLLARSEPNRYQWIMNRDDFYDLRERELDGIDLGPTPDAVSPRFALVATFSSLASEDATRRSAYYLCQYELTDLSNRQVLWADKYEVKKTAVKGFLD